MLNETTDQLISTGDFYNPFTLSDMTGDKPQSKKLIKLVEKFSGLATLAKEYEKLERNLPPREFAATTMEKLNIDYRVTGKSIASLPSSGATLIVANHPFGGIDGIILAHLLSGIRDDVRILANGFLKRIPELSNIFIGVDPYNRESSIKDNRQPMREAVRWLKNGGMLVVFPAGEVSRFQFNRMGIVDNDWDASIARIARITKATVVPFAFSGRNSLSFHVWGSLHPVIRTLMLPRELLNKRDHCISVRIGKKISHDRIKRFENDKDLARYLRLRSIVLQRNDSMHLTDKQDIFFDGEPVNDPVERLLIRKEVEALPQENLLVDGEELQVYFASATEVPAILQEIGRLREITFRKVGEGTGKVSDLDIYDEYYTHLFIYNRKKEEIVGAYRLGLSDRILALYGKKGLYTNSLFKYSRRFLNAMGPAIELGRSFVRYEYQRSFSPLLLLWKGIGEFVVRNPEYTHLFGPVSISNEYTSLSQQLLIDFLKVNSFDNKLARLVRPRNNWKPKMRPVWRKADIDGNGSLENVSELVSVIEEDEKSIPILLKQYLKMGGRMLCFNVDENFNDCLDGLVLVDLRKTEKKALQRYMGKNGTEQFLTFHAPASRVI